MGAGQRNRGRGRNSIYSDDEDFGRKHFVSREDEYDEEDDFVAPSDEEEEVVEEEEDEDDGIVLEDGEGRRQRTPKRGREATGDEADAEGEVDEERVAGGKGKRRRVVDEDEEGE